MKNSSFAKVLPLAAIVFAASSLSPFNGLTSRAQSGDDERAFSEAKNNISLVNKTQIITLSATEKTAYLKTFDELDIGTLRGGRTAAGTYFNYKIMIRSKKLAAIGAKPKDSQQNGFNGATFRYKNKYGMNVMESIICKSNAVGADGTAIKNLPVVNKSGELKLICAAGWKNIAEESK